MVASPTKKLKSSVRSFIGAVAASTASRRRLTAAAPAPLFTPSTPALSFASSKSKQSAGKLLSAQHHNFFDADADPHGPSNESIAKLREKGQARTITYFSTDYLLRTTDCYVHTNCTSTLIPIFSDIFGPHAARLHLHSTDSSPVQRRFTTALHGPSGEGVVLFNPLKKPFVQLPLTRSVIAKRGLNWGMPSKRGARTASPTWQTQTTTATHATCTRLVTGSTNSTCV